MSVLRQGYKGITDMREHKEDTLINSPGYGCIYCITNKLNGKKYIGQTSREYVSQRWAEHKWLSKTDESNMEVHKALKEFGIENFDFEVVLDNVPINELFDKEVEYIKKFKIVVPDGYNSTLGGAGTPGFEPWDKGIKRSEETKKKIRDKWTLERRKQNRERVLGEKNPMYGKCGELLPTFGLRKFGCDNPFFGKKHSDETKRKLSNARDDEKKKITMCFKGTFNEIIEFESLSAAARYIREHTSFKNADDSAISKSARGMRSDGTPKVAYGYSWKFREG